MAKQNGSSGFNFGEMSNYSSGGGIPEGDYVLTDLTVKHHSFTKQDGSAAGPPRLGVMITLVPLAGGEELTQFYSLGSNADKSWAPNPNTGKGIVPIPGGPGTPPNASTNWAVFVQNLINSGLPNGILQDDLSVLEGTHVHMSNIPEPEERKGFQSRTGEAAGGENRSKTIAVVTEIKDDGKPWEGTGGIPAQEEKPAAKANGKVAAKVVTKPAAAKVAAQAPADTDDVEQAAISATATVLSDPKFAKGISKIMLRTSSFKAAGNPVVGNSILNAYFNSDTDLEPIVAQHGYKIVGAMVVPA